MEKGNVVVFFFLKKKAATPLAQVLTKQPNPAAFI